MTNSDTHHSTGNACALCGRSIPDESVDHEGATFCSTGCRDVRATLGLATQSANDAQRGEAGDRSSESGHGDGHGSSPAPPGESSTGTRTFLRVDGLESATGEAYLASVAEALDGVERAEASYVTETIRIDHDPDAIEVATLCDELSVLGYRATALGDEGDATRSIDAGPGGTSGTREFDDTLDFRYAAGVLFGAFLMLPYVALLYPAHLSSLLGGGMLDQFAVITFDGPGGLLFVRLYLVLTGIVLVFTGMPLLRGAYVGLKMRQPTTDLLVSITVLGAYVYSSLAALAGRGDVYYDLTIVVTAVVVGAIYHESLQKRRAMDRLTDLTVSRVSEARVYEADGSTRTVAVENLAPGDRVLVRAGERIPVDGVLAEGACTVDEAVVTGESLPITKRAGDDVVGGSVVADDAAVVTVGEDATSRIDRLVTAVWNVQSAEHGAQRRANAIAGTVAPLLLAAAVLVGIAHVVLGGDLLTAVLLSLTVLLVASPWGLGLATPLSVASSIRDAMGRGVVVFDETVFERLRAVDVVVFDKTGTLTTGEMDVREADAPDDVLDVAAALERRASHPAANAIVDAFGASGDESTTERGAGADSSTAFEGDGGTSSRSDGAHSGGAHSDDAHSSDEERVRAPVEDFRSHANGVQGTVDGDDVLVGNLACYDEQGWTVADDIRDRVSAARESGQLPVVVGRNGTAAGTIVVGDEPREGWEATVTGLAERGTDVVVLTGDDAAAAEQFDGHPAVDHVFAAVPPEGKTAAVEALRSNGTVAMVGDGTNDAPALASADLGISLGSATALASEAADVAIVDDDLPSVETAFALARAARTRMRQNEALSLAFNAIAIPLAIVGLLNPLVAMLALLVTCGLLVGNGSRSLLDPSDGGARIGSFP